MKIVDRVAAYFPMAALAAIAFLALAIGGRR